MDVNNPFHFAIANGTPVAERAKVPGHIAETFGVRGRIEFVRRDSQMRLYRVIAGK